MTEPALRALLDREAIRDQLYRYCRAVDRIDEPLGRSVFHAGATADYGAEIFQGSGADAIAFICDQHRRAAVHSHQVTNVLIALDGDRAASEAYVVSALRTEIDGRLTEFTTWGRYLDRWSRRGGAWAIDHRLVVRDLDTIAEARPLSVPGRGRRDATDPSYAVLAGSPIDD